MTSNTDSYEELKRLIKLPKIVSDANAIHIHLVVKRLPRIKGTANYIDFKLMKNLTDTKRIQCVVCSSVCVYPLFFNCGHLICNFCYIRHFEHNHFKRFNEYYTKCPKCKAFSKSCDVLTIMPQLNIRSNTKISMAIKKALVKCDESGCDQAISLDNWAHHVKYECSYRVVQCPANNCPFVGTVDYVTTHSTQSPFHCVLCAGCKMNWTVLATDHSCQKTKEFAKLTNKSIYHRQGSEPEDGSLYLPIRSYNDESFDIFALKKVHDLILNYRLAEAVSSIVTYPNSSKLPLRVSSSQNSYHIN